MHKLPAFVFKLLGISIVLMFLLDTSLVVAETISVHSKVTNLAKIMQNEVARNNCMPTDLANMFDAQLRNIVESSNVASDTFKTNMRTDVPKDGVYYKSLSESNQAAYGDIVQLIVEITMEPSVVYFNIRGADRAENSMLKKGILQYTLSYSYNIPCLRYIK